MSDEIYGDPVTKVRLFASPVKQEFQMSDFTCVRAKRLIAMTPAGRAGTAEEIAEAVVYFLSASRFVTGQVLAVDGGLSQK